MGSIPKGLLISERSKWHLSICFGKAAPRGVRAAAAPLVFLGETDAYPDRGWSELRKVACATGREG